MIVVLGAGVAGLAAAERLGRSRRGFLVLEREPEAGGWCRSVSNGPYTFDMSGHFLHCADPAIRARLAALPRLRWREVARDARVLLRGRLTPYPFQSNLHGHDPALVTRCLAGFAAERIREAVGGERKAAHFEEWLGRRFGAGMCRAFFFPYNRKMWRRPLRSMTYEWTDWAVPVPTFDEVLAGARGAGRSGVGYNARFLYPVRGGIGALPAAMAAPLAGRIRTGVEAVSVDLRRRVVATSSGEEIPYRALVSTIPLPELVARAKGAPSSVTAAARRLDWIRVLALNVGVRNPGSFSGHWHYAPGKEHPFFRVGCLTNVSSSAAPEGCASFFAERSFPATERIDVARESDRMLEGLRRIGAIGPRSVVEAVCPVLLDPAYVVFDEARRRAVPAIRSALERVGVFPAGRYGAWDYFGMERSIADGLRAAAVAASFRG